MPGMLARVGGKAGEFEGFTRTWRDVSALDMEDELKQVRFYCTIAPTYAPWRVLITSPSSIALYIMYNTTPGDFFFRDQLNIRVSPSEHVQLLL